MKNNIAGWFEIPVNDLKRAIGFYEKVFSIKMEQQQLGDLQMAFFPWIEEGKGCSGALVYHREHYKPSSSEGTLLYFTPPSGDLANELAIVEEAGGKIIQGKTLITPEIGYMALFLDTEGNRLAMHCRE